jgi:hypothetical protein
LQLLDFLRHDLHRLGGFGNPVAGGPESLARLAGVFAIAEQLIASATAASASACAARAAASNSVKIASSSSRRSRSGKLSFASAWTQARQQQRQYKQAV